MTTGNTSGESTGSRKPQAELDRQYGRIAISALVAALPYCSETKSENDAPAKSRKGRAA
jgi:hypothetical protein